MTHPPSPSGPREPGGRTAAIRTPCIVAASCGALILLLALSLGGVFAVRALTEDEDPQATQSQEESAEESADSDGQPAEGEGEESAETGGDGASQTDGPSASPPADAHPQGTPIEHTGESIEGHVEVVIDDVDWDATEWVQEQDQITEQAPAGQKYLKTEVELTYHGPDDFTPLAWASVSYVGQDGTSYQEAGVATPSDTEQETSTDGQTQSQQWVFLVPEDLPEGGHFVIGDFGSLEEAQWVEAV